MSMSAMIVGIVMIGVLGLTSAYPTLKDQDYLEYIAELASKGREAFNGNPDAFDVLYDQYMQYSPKYKSLAIQALEEEMNENRDDGYTLSEMEDEEAALLTGKLTVAEGWPVQTLNLGQVGGVAVCPEGYPHVFHRASRTWSQDSFAEDNTYAQQASGPIPEPTVLTINASNGVILDQWGSEKFFMPHGLTIDHEGNMWLTDVALHQVFKYSPKKELLLTLGEAFVPAKDNSDESRFCKPTDVAVASNGDFFVADGYCNSRVVKYSATGEFIGQFGVNQFAIPHSLALLEEYGDEEVGVICVADREHESIRCFDAGLKDPNTLGQEVRQYQSMGRVYSIAFSDKDGLLFGVSTGEEEEPQGFTIDLSENQRFYNDIISTWSPNDQGFSAPHALAISPDGENVYVGEVITGKKNFWKFDRAEETKEEREEVEEEEDENGNEEEEEEDEEDEEEDDTEKENEEENDVAQEENEDKED